MPISIDEPKNWDQVADCKTFLTALFEPDDIIRTVTVPDDFYPEKETGKPSPRKGQFKRKVGSYISSLDKNPTDIANTLGDWDKTAGGYVGVNALDGKGVYKKNVVCFRNTLIESDTLSLEDQAELFEKLNLPIRTLVHSGGKSLHAVCAVDAPDVDTYESRVKFLHEVLRQNGVEVDKATKDPGRLTRLPGVTRNGNPQFLIATNIGADSWDSWFESVKDEYQDAAGKVQATPITVISASDLAKANLPPPTWIVPNFLPAGAGMIVGASKVGKSWMVLDLGLSVAAGQPFLKFKTNQCSVLYCALEDSLVRLQDRMNKILWGREPPEGFDFAVEIPGIQNGLTASLDNYLKKNPSVQLIIIDTLQKVRGTTKPGESVYASDYREMTALKRFADSHNIAVLVVHHTRKMKDSDDIFNTISGTTGLMGCADTIVMLTKDQRSSSTAHLNLTGRDVMQQDLIVEFNKLSCKWELLGDQETFLAEQARKEYDDSPIVRTINKLLEQDADHEWSGTSSDLLKCGLAITGGRIAPSPRKLSSMLKDIDYLLQMNDGILHSVRKHGNAGNIHQFWYVHKDDESDETEK